MTETLQALRLHKKLLEQELKRSATRFNQIRKELNEVRRRINTATRKARRAKNNE